MHACPRPARPRRRRLGPHAGVALLLVAFVALTGCGGLGSAPGTVLLPPRPADARPAPLVLPPSVVDPGGYTFMDTRPDGSPVVWDPCRPVHVVVRPDGEPPGGRQLVEESLATVGRAAGLVFVVDGETDEGPDDGRATVDRGRYGDRFAPVLLTWTSSAEHPELDGALGRAGPTSVTHRAATWYASGTVALDAAWFAESLGDGLGRRRASAVLQHELGHLVGLGHSSDPFSLMSPTYQSVFTFSLSDRAGLARMGGGDCVEG